MNINRENYESILVDYADGTLADEMRLQVDKFLLLNPDIKDEFDLFGDSHLKDSNEAFTGKDNLKNIPFYKTLSTSEHFQQLCIAYIEGELNDNELQFFNKMVDGDALKKKELALFKKTVLTPDFTIVYPDKRKIKRFTLLSPTIKKQVSFIASVAAILVLAFMVFYATTLNNKTQIQGSYAEKNRNNNIEKTITTNNTDTFKANTTKEQGQSILHDPFGFEKISVKSHQTAVNSNLIERESVNHIQPIGVKQINCKPCKKVFSERLLLKGSVNKPVNELNVDTNTKHRNSQKTDKTVINKNKIWQLAQVGISEINKVTNTRIKVEEFEKQNKTKIAFNSRLFSFSTSVNKKNN